MGIRFGQEPTLSSPLTDNDMGVVSRPTYGVGAQFQSYLQSDLATYIKTKLGPLAFAGTWNALTNTPTLTSGIGVNGAVYVVNTAGTTDLNGHNDWKIGDWAVFDGNISEWTQVANEVISTVNIYNTDGVLTSARTLDTNAFNLAMNGTGNINLDVPNLYLTQTSGNSTTVGSATFDGIANQGAQTYKGKFNVVVDDETGVNGTTLLRFSNSFPNVVAMGKAEGTEAAPLIVSDNTLINVIGHAVYDGTSFGGKPNFNPIIEELFFAASGQAAGNSPGAYMFAVNLSGNGSTVTPFMTFNLSSQGEAAFGPNTSASGLNSVVLGNNISNTVANEVLIGNTVGLTTISSPIVNIDAPQIGLVSAPFSGGGTQYLTVDNSGNLIPDGGAGGINIYNADGSLTADRILTLNGHNLTITGAGSESVYIYAGITQIGANNGQFLSIIARASLNYTPFNNGTQQFVGTDGSGQFITLVPQNIYNHDDVLLGNRVVTMSTHSLRFTGTSNFTVDSDGIDLAAVNSNLTVHTTGTGDVLLKTTSTGKIRFESATAINFTSSDINFLSAPFSGGGTQYLTVDTLGHLVPAAAPGSTNIYNTDGSLTANRTVTLGTDTLAFSGSAASAFNINVPNVGVKGFLSTTNDPGAAPYTINYNGSTFNSQFFSLNSNAGNFGAIIENINSGNTTMLAFARALGTAQSSRAIVTPGTLIGWIDFFGYDGVTYRQAATMQCQVLTATAGTVTSEFNFVAHAFNFSGAGGVSFGSGCTASGATSFSQGNTNIVTSIQSAALGGLLNTINGVSSGEFVSNGCTVNAGSGTAGYGVIIGSYNSLSTDNLTGTFFSTTAVNNGLRSGIFGGQINKINAPNALLSGDNFIFGGNTNTMTGAVNYSTIGQSDSCIVGDNSNTLAGSWIFNSVSCSLLPNAAIGNSNMVDLNGTNNTVKSHYAFLINCKNNIITSNTFGLGGRYFLANAVNYSIPAGNYVSALNAQTGTLDGNYSTQLSCNNTTFTANATYATVVSGQNHTNGGTSSAILNGNTNVIGNVQNSAAIGSNCTVNHNECLLINDGAAALASANDRTIVIQAANGLALGRGTNNPTRDVVIGKKAGFYPVNIGIDFDTASLEAVQYNIDTSGNNVTGTLADADKVGGNFFIFNKTDPGNQVIILPASGTINGSSSVSVSGVGPYIVVCNGTNWFVR